MYAELISVSTPNRYPLHCAVKGGNLQLVRWLREAHECPIFEDRGPKTSRKLSLRTSCNRSLIDLAVSGEPKIEILRYLVVRQKISMNDLSSHQLARDTLEAFLKGEEKFEDTSDTTAMAENYRKESVANISANDAVSSPLKYFFT